MKIYISGKITGLEFCQAMKNFDDAAQIIALHGLKPINPMKLPQDHDKSWKSYMKEDLKALKGCIAIFMLKDWEDSRGARIEHWFALRYGYFVYYL